jgi:hypothetical protein
MAREGRTLLAAQRVFAVVWRGRPFTLMGVSLAASSAADAGLRPAVGRGVAGGLR